MPHEPREQSRSWWMPTSLVLALTICMPLAVTAGISGKTSVEKMLTNMAQPLFVSIVGTLVVGVALFRRCDQRRDQRGDRGVGMALMIGSSLLWMLSSQAFVSTVLRAWESSVPSAPFASNEPFDYVVVLGGGTTAAPDGRAQFGTVGDRVGYAARLYLSGMVKHLVTTGDNLSLTGTLSGEFQQQDDPSQQTKKIWIDLGIPEEAISELAGQNTSSEIASLKSHPEYWQGKRCAILTSAIHMPRAMRLASRAGISALPIVADYRSGTGPLTCNQFLPDAEELLKLQFVIKEWIGMQVGR